jgi:uncharacterized protein (UPF0276 family)
VPARRQASNHRTGAFAVNPSFLRNDARRSGPVGMGQPIPARAGVGLRLPHHEWVLERHPDIAWLEVHPENYMTDGSASEELERIARGYPLSLHAVGLSLGSPAGPDPEHLARLGQLVARYQPGLVSDHLSWSASDGIHLPDLLPLPYTEEALAVFTGNVERVQDALARPILVENPSRYMSLPHSILTEAEFLEQLVRRTGCGVLLDINNIYVTAHNCGADPESQLEHYLRRLPHGSVGELHLAGHDASGPRLIDDHGSQVCADVWQLFRTAVATLGPRPTLIEWDTRLPSFEVLQGEARVAQWIMTTAERLDAVAC